MRAGAPDKVVFEAGASCLPVFASNPVFDDFLPATLRFPREDAAALAGRLRELAAPTGRIGHELRNGSWPATPPSTGPSSPRRRRRRQRPAGSSPALTAQLGAQRPKEGHRSSHYGACDSEGARSFQVVAPRPDVSSDPRRPRCPPVTIAPTPRDPPAMKVLIVTGIYPPDIGGPATHADDVRRALTDRGHEVTVLTLTDEPRPRSAARRAVPPSWPWPLRTAAALAWRRGRPQFDVVYATGLDSRRSAVPGRGHAGRAEGRRRSGLGARRARKASPTWSFDDFQDERADRSRSGRCARSATGRRGHATALLSPSPHLAARAGRWARRNDVRVIPNGVRRRRARRSRTDGASRPAARVRRATRRAQARRQDHRCGRAERSHASRHRR